ARLSLQHRPKEQFGQGGQSGDVELNLAIRFWQRNRGELPVLRIPCTVDEDVHSGAFPLQLIKQQLRRGGGCQVHRHSLSRNIELPPEFVRTLAKLSPPARHHPTIVPVTPQQPA